MKTRYAVLFAIGAFLVAGSVRAVPPRPINAMSVILLPADGAPDSLRKMVATFNKGITKVNSDAETKRAQLDRQMEEGLDKAIAKAQSSGDINTVLALKAAKDQFATLTTSDVPLVKNALEFREKKTVEIETARVADAMKAAKELNDELEKAKKDETVKGNFDTAKAIADHQEKLVAWSQTLRTSAPQPTAVRPKPMQPRPNAQPEPPRQRTEPPRTIVVQAVSSTGTSIGFAKAGEVFKIQYVAGSWETGYGIVESPDSARLRRQDDRCVIVRRSNPSFQVAILPAGTKQRPYSFTAPQDGEYALRAWDGMSDYRPGYFNDNHGSVRYSVQKTQAAAPSASTPAAGAAPSPFAARRQEQTTAVETKTVYVSATRPYGGVVAELKAGDKFTVRYLDGKWRAGALDWSPDVSPDSHEEELVRRENAAMIMRTSDLPDNYLENDRALSGTTYDRIPAGTAMRPFSFTVPEDGVYRIRIAEPGWARDYRDNNGTVSYEVKIFRSGAK